MNLCELCEDCCTFQCPLCRYYFCKEHCFTWHKCEKNNNQAIFEKEYPKCPKCNRELINRHDPCVECIYCGQEMCRECFVFNLRHLKICQCDHCRSDYSSTIFDPSRTTCVEKFEEFQENHPKDCEPKFRNLRRDGFELIEYSLYVEKFKKEKLEAECEQLKQKINELKELITEYECMPPIENGGGIEYQKTKRHFEEMQ